MRSQGRTEFTSEVRACTSRSRIEQSDLVCRDQCEGTCTEGKSMRQDTSLSARASRRSFFIPRAPTPSVFASVAGTTRTSWPLGHRQVGDREGLRAGLDNDPRWRSVEQLAQELRRKPLLVQDRSVLGTKTDLGFPSTQIDSKMLHGWSPSVAPRARERLRSKRLLPRAEGGQPLHQIVCGFRLWFSFLVFVSRFRFWFPLRMLAPAPAALSLRMQVLVDVPVWLAALALTLDRRPFAIRRPPLAPGKGGRRMANWTTLPHEKLIAYQVARELVTLVRQASISNSRLREQALNAASSACLNIAEATGRSGRADQKRVYAIARGEICEAAAALDIAALGGGCSADALVAASAVARRAYALLSGLIRQ
jgi:four helix bundle protein